MGNSSSCCSRDAGKTEYEFTRLHKISALGDKARLVHALTNGNIDCQDDKGRTALYFACTFGCVTRLTLDRIPTESPAKKSNFLEIADALLKKSANPNICDFEGVSPLHIASWRDSFDNGTLIGKLIDSGAKINVRDSAGRMPLHFAFMNRAEGFCIHDLHCNAAANLLLRGSLVFSGDAESSIPLPIFGAIQANNIPFIEEAAERFPTILDGRRSGDGATPLIASLEAGSMPIFDLILKHRPDQANRADANGRTPLLAALTAPKCDEQHADGAVAEEENEEYEEMALVLIESGCDLRCMDSLGWEPVHRAAGSGMCRALSEILRRYGDAAWLARCGENGLNALGIAIERHRLEISALLLEYASTNLQAINIWEGCALHHAAALATDHATNQLLSWASRIGIKVETEVEDSRGRTAAHVAALKKNHHALSALLEANADAGSEDFQKNTPLHLAVANVTTESQESVLACVELLVTASASVNAVNSDGRTALHLLARSGTESIQVMAKLLTHDADPNIIDSKNASVLEEISILFLRAKVGSHSESARHDQVRHLIAYGADPRTVSLTPAAASPATTRNSESQISRVSQALSENPLFCAVRVGAVKRFEDLVAQQESLGEVSERGQPLLHAAVAAHSVPIIKTLIQRNCDPNLRDPSGRTVLHVAMELTRKTGSAVVAEIIGILVGARADVNATRSDGSGFTAMHMAVKIKNSDLVRTLTDFGASIEVADGEGVTPLKLAETIWPQSPLTDPDPDIGELAPALADIRQWESVAISAPDNFFPYIDIPFPGWFCKWCGRSRRVSHNVEDLDAHSDHGQRRVAAVDPTVSNIWHTGLSEYTVLGVSQSASRDQARAVYRGLVLFWHRDKFEQRFGDKIVDGEREIVMKHVAVVGTSITEAWKRLVQKRGWTL